MNLNFKLKYISISLLFVLGWIISGCSSDNLQNRDNPELSPLKIGAEIKPEKTTRGYQASGPIIAGDYYLTYRNSDNVADLAKVSFYDGVGYVTKNDISLDWNGVGENITDKNTAIFILDNVPGEDQTEDCIVQFEENTPYQAGKFDTDGGTNDLLWGVKQVARETPVINFDLHHCMSRILLEVTVEENSEILTEGLNLENAIAKISCLQLKPEKYNRLSGDLILPEEIKSEDLVLVNSENSWFDNEEITEDEIKKTIYKSYDFVIPPQELHVGENRPRLSITLKKNNGEEVTYSGFIPNIMVREEEDGTIIPMTLSLLRGNVMTLHVRLSPEPLEIIFLPVTVAEWVDKGTFIIGAKQAELNDSNFSDFIEALNRGEESELTKYGYKNSDGSWVFNIFKDFELKLSDISNKVNSDLPFTFAMHNWTVNILDDNGDILYEIKKAETLVKLLKSA